MHFRFEPSMLSKVLKNISWNLFFLVRMEFDGNTSIGHATSTSIQICNKESFLERKLVTFVPFKLWFVIARLFMAQLKAGGWQTHLL